MVKVQLVYTKTCVWCPMAKELFKELKGEYNFDYEEVDAMSPEGQKLVTRFFIMAVPVVIVDDKVKFVGMPTRERAIDAITNS